MEREKSYLFVALSIYLPFKLKKLLFIASIKKKYRYLLIRDVKITILDSGIQEQVLKMTTQSARCYCHTSAT